jgi:predicted phage terminase large subunit-like protein
MLSNKQTTVNNERKKLLAIRIAACRELYESGLSARKIEAAMRALGFTNFSSRILFPRRQGRGQRGGWIKEFGWSSTGATTGAQASCLQAAKAADEAALPQTLSDVNIHHAGGTGVGRQDACAPVDFPEWLKSVSPNMHWDWKFQQVLYGALDRIRTGKNKRLMINIPPRHGKSELVTVRWIAWMLLNNPALNIILASYNQSLANRFSRKIRQVICDATAATGAQASCLQAAKAADEAGLPRTLSDANVHHAGETGVGRQDACAPVEARAQVARATRFRCAQCRAEAAAARQRHARNTASDSKRESHTCRTSEPVNIDDCSKCGASLESEPPASAGGNGAEVYPTEHGIERAAYAHADNPPEFASALPPAHAGGSDTAQTQKMFPFTSSKPVNRISEWGTAAGGGLKAVGVGAGVTGFGGDIIMIDDPVKNRAQAESKTYRERLWDWYTDDLYTRLEPEGSIVLIQTRWHEDDLAGRLIKQTDEGGETWEVVNMPAIAELGSGDMKLEPESEPPALAGGKELSEPPALAGGNDATANPTEEASGRAAHIGTDHTIETESTLPPAHAGGSDLPKDWRVVGEALCPQRFDVPKLVEIKDQLGTYSFSALYQQHPSPAEGTIFKREWLTNIVDRAPAGLKWFRGYDLAISTKTTADYTASVRMAVDDMGVMYIADGFRRRIEYPEQRRFIFERIATERDTQHGIEASGNAEAIVSELRRQRILLRWPFRLIKVVKDKTTRALAWSPRAEEGKLKLVRGPWIDEFVEELASFPVGEHDDQVDAVSVAVEMMSAGGDRRMYAF